VDADDDDEITERLAKFVPAHPPRCDNAFALVPMESDLNSNETLNELLDYVVKIQEDMLYETNHGGHTSRFLM
jgi:hypothetical protein